MSRPTFSRLIVPSACVLVLGLTVIGQTHHAVAQIPASGTLAPAPGPAPAPVFEQPILADDGANRDSGYWKWSHGGYIWNAGNWGSTIGLYGRLAHTFVYSGEQSSGRHGLDQQFYYHTTVSHVSEVSSVGNVGGARARPAASAGKIPD